MTIQPLSQYDERWKNIKLGTSNLTIGEAGCLITCCSMLASTTPDLLNKKLIEIGGYADQNLLIWAKLDEATNDKLKFNWLNYVYNNAGVKQIIADEGACIVRVDNNGIMHFVVYIGNGQMIDPLGGQVVSTSKYTPVGFADIKIDKSISDPLQECLKQHTQLVTECDLLKKQLTEKDTLISTQAKDLDNKNKEIISLEKKLELFQNEMDTKLAKKDLDCEDKIKDFTTSLTKDLELKEINYKKTILNLEKELKKRPIITLKPEKPKTLKGKLEAILDILL